VALVGCSGAACGKSGACWVQWCCMWKEWRLLGTVVLYVERVALVGYSGAACWIQWYSLLKECCFLVEWYCLLGGVVLHVGYSGTLC
jgi:hypothetical protein